MNTKNNQRHQDTIAAIEAVFFSLLKEKELKDISASELCEKAGISPASVTKMGRNGHVTTEILVKICTALDCQIEDIMEIVPDDK